MNFAYDADKHFYYYGENEPHSQTWHELVNRWPKLIAVDTETVSLEDKTMLGFAIAFSPNEAMYFEYYPEKCPVVPYALLLDKSVTKIFHNASFDLFVLRPYAIDFTSIIDTHVMALLTGSTSNTLEDLAPLVSKEVHSAKEMLDAVVKTKTKMITVKLDDGSKIKIEDEVECRGKKTMLDLPKSAVAKKCCQDAMATFALYYYFKDKIDWQYFGVEMKALSILERMSQQGIKLDKVKLEEVSNKVMGELSFFKERCTELGFRVNSNDEIGLWLANQGAYSQFAKLPINKKSGKLKTDEDTLRKINHPAVGLILKFRELDKLRSTYIEPYMDADRAWTRFHPDAATGRPSSTDRNLQNLPPFIRCVMLPDKDEWTDSDWSQTELRLLAYQSGDKQMLWIYSLPETDPRADIHQATADFMHIPRKLAKNVNFCMIYGGSVQTIMDTAEIADKEVAARLRKGWFDAYPGAAAWIEEQQYHATHQKAVAKTMFGRLLPITPDYPGDMAGIARKAVNYPIQGSAAEILKRGLIICENYDLTLQIHDEMLIDGRVELPIEALSHISPMYTPVKVKYLKRWE